MSKAFTKDDEGGLEKDVELEKPQPKGDRKVYITPQGFEKIKAEYDELFHNERPKLVETIAWAASNGDRSENGDYIYGKRRMREIDRRLKYLGQRIANAVVVDPKTQPKDRVLFGAQVTVEDEHGKSLLYIIVGEDEIDVENRKISWVSPVAKALIGAKVGDVVTVQRPSGPTEVEILDIQYASK